MGNGDSAQCVSLIGMAGAGKSTLGRLLAGRMGWAHVDTDRLVEAYYMLPLQEIMDTYGLDEFLRIEDYLVGQLGVQRAIISTGGSVIYGRLALPRLKLLGPVIFLEVGLTTFLDRVGSTEGRAFARPPGKTLEGVFRERQPLYRAVADLTIRTDQDAPETCADRIADWLAASALLVD